MLCNTLEKKKPRTYHEREEACFGVSGRGSSATVQCKNRCVFHHSNDKDLNVYNIILVIAQAFVEYGILKIVYAPDSLGQWDLDILNEISYLSSSKLTNKRKNDTKQSFSFLQSWVVLFLLKISKKINMFK